VTTFRLEIVTAEKVGFSEDVTMITAWGSEGQFTILPHHAPFMTILQPGKLVIKKDGGEQVLALLGGFLEVRRDKVIILADAYERAEEINIARAEQAQKRAEEILKTKPSKASVTAAEAALRRSLARLKATNGR
jgi:F-type H+-transporting ATPase subunit epsilon